MFRWLSRNAKKAGSGKQELCVQQVTFLCEQDGSVERELKASWVRRLNAELQVTLACLVRVRYGGSPDQKVALCLRADGADQRVLVDKVTADFKRLFKTRESLDVIFLSPAQQEKLLQVAKPFYQQTTHQA